MEVVRRKGAREIRVTHNRVLFWIIIFLLAVLIVLLVSILKFENKSDSINDTGFECVADTDCVPATCCHATSCTSLGLAPKCDDAICTQECRLDALDCGQGSCKCIDKKCSAVLA